MYSIGALSEKTGVSTQTIRFYERMGIMPPAARAENGYRVYGDADLEQLRFINGARRLDISLDEIRGILTFRDRNQAPCVHVHALIDQQIQAVQERIRQLEALRDELIHIRDTGETLPQDVEMKNCICGLIALEENE